MNRLRLYSILAISILFLSAGAATYTVDLGDNSSDGSCSNGDCSFSDTLAEVNAETGVQTKGFSPLR